MDGLKKPTGQLFIVATPIGNYADITLRALEVLKAADVILCEERREGTTLLRKLGVEPKRILLLNEHNEPSSSEEALSLLSEGLHLALISDCGTPVFADPGACLIRKTREAGIKVVPVPGASSLMTMFSVLDYRLERFYFAGFLPRDSESSRRRLNQLKNMKDPIVLMDTPYRLKKLLAEAVLIFGENRNATLGFNLTLPDEQICRGTLRELQQQSGEKKGEFILVVDGVVR